MAKRKKKVGWLPWVLILAVAGSAGYLFWSKMERAKTVAANGVVLTLSSIDPKLGGGATFIGERGRITIFREGYECDPVGMDQDPLPPHATRVYQSDNHMENFFACVASRKDPIMNVEAGHSVATLCHLGNIARRLGRRLNWDSEREIFPGDDEAKQFIDCPKRKGYELPEKV